MLYNYLYLILFIVFLPLILNILSGLFYSIVNIFNSFTVVYLYRKDNSFFRKWLNYNYDSALNLDRYANYNFRSLWNLLFQRNGYKFGNYKETISYVLGANQYHKKLTIFGWIIVIILWIFDISNWLHWNLLFKWKPKLKFKKGHCMETYLNTNKNNGKMG